MELMGSAGSPSYKAPGLGAIGVYCAGDFRNGHDSYGGGDGTWRQGHALLTMEHVAPQRSARLVA